MITALPPPIETMSCRDAKAEVREWDGETLQDEIAPTFREEVGMDTPIEGRVEQLITGDAEDSERLMRELQEELRRGNRRVALSLATAFRQHRYDVDARGLALETLAAARVRWFESEVVELVRRALDAIEPELQFAGIAAASDLSRSNQVAVSRIIRSLAIPESGSSVARAAAAFLRRVNRDNLARL